MRFHFKQIERSLAEIKQFFRTLWICAPHGRVMLASYNAWLVGQVIADIRFLWHTHRCFISCRCIPRLGSSGAFLRLEARKLARGKPRMKMAVLCRGYRWVDLKKRSLGALYQMSPTLPHVNSISSVSPVTGARIAKTAWPAGIVFGCMPTAV
jgi:hypothetical protein